MGKDPAKVTITQLREALTVLGIEPDTKNLLSVTIEPGLITLVRHRVDAAGKSFVVAYERSATETVEIAVVNE